MVVHGTCNTHCNAKHSAKPSCTDGHSHRHSGRKVGPVVPKNGALQGFRYWVRHPKPAAHAASDNGLEPPIAELRSLSSVLSAEGGAPDTQHARTVVAGVQVPQQHLPDMHTHKMGSAVHAMGPLSSVAQLLCWLYFGPAE